MNMKPWPTSGFCPFIRLEWSVRKPEARIAGALTLILSRFLSKTSCEPVYLVLVLPLSFTAPL
jgi:hypothetical protein